MIIPILISLLAPVVSATAAWFAYRSKKGVAEIHLMINSRMDAWLKAATESAHAAGVEFAKSAVAETVAKALLQTAETKAIALIAVARETADKV
jgi:hypothetical protein